MGGRPFFWAALATSARGDLSDATQLPTLWRTHA
jgi:hypothetical protein